MDPGIILPQRALIVNALGTQRKSEGPHWETPKCQNARYSSQRHLRCLASFIDATYVRQFSRRSNWQIPSKMAVNPPDGAQAWRQLNCERGIGRRNSGGMKRCSLNAVTPGDGGESIHTASLHMTLES